jgi:uncharacterized protein (DUF849 family)
MNSDKVVITVALSGSITRRGEGPGMSPYIPVTPDEFAEEARRCYDAGATVMHIHARDPQTGAPSSDVNHFRDIVEKIKAACPALINITTGGAPGMTLDERLAPIPALKPDMASFTSGSMSFGLYSRREKKFVFDVGQGLAFHEMVRFADVMRDNGVKPECEVYGHTMLNNLKILEPLDVFKKPLHLQFVMGIMGQCTPATPRNLIRLVDSAHETFDEFTWSVCATRLDQWPMITQAAILGAQNIRTGMEDNIYMEPGVLAGSNAEMVEKTVRLAEGVGRQIADLEETREIFRLGS